VFVLVKVERVKRELGLGFHSRMDIVAKILSEAVGGAEKTNIMCRCNLNFGQLQTYLDLLLNTGLLMEVSSILCIAEMSVYQIFLSPSMFLHHF